MNASDFARFVTKWLLGKGYYINMSAVWGRKERKWNPLFLVDWLLDSRGNTCKLFAFAFFSLYVEWVFNEVINSSQHLCCAKHHPTRRHFCLEMLPDRLRLKCHSAFCYFNQQKIGNEILSFAFFHHTHTRHTYERDENGIVFRCITWTIYFQFLTTHPIERTITYISTTVADSGKAAILHKSWVFQGRHHPTTSQQ